MKNGISVIMPSYNQGAFISRAIKSLLLQSLSEWELIIINDGSDDYTSDVVKQYELDTRIRYQSNEYNLGLGKAINQGLELASYDYIAYLPSDDIFYKDHLQTLYDCIHGSETILCYSGVLHHYLDLSSQSGANTAEGQIDGLPLQLVQVMHKKTNKRWTERSDLVTNDLNRMFWSDLLKHENVLYSGKVTCEWVDHPEQHHKITDELFGGGIYLYKQFYKVKEPILFHSSTGNLIDEIREFDSFRKLQPIVSDKPLKILIVGELAYNPERICALQKQGHKLYGLWISNPSYYNAVGPLAFGNIEDVSLDNLIEWAECTQPDVIYALLNHQAVPLANYVLRLGLNVPFVWHFKEGPFVCRQNGNWKELIELYTNSDGRIFTNEETRKWFSQFLSEDKNTLLLDGDLPHKKWFEGEASGLLSGMDGEIHTVITGRPYGFTEDIIKELAENKIHLHFYSNIQHAYWQDFIHANKRLGANNLHLHSHCSPNRWVSELSRYDAGWLHIFHSKNENEYMKAAWPDLNYPARLSTLAAAGVPMILKNNPGHIVATQALIENLGIGYTFNSIEELKRKLSDKRSTAEIRRNLQLHKFKFCFDYHVERLISFFNQVIIDFKTNRLEPERALS